MAALIDAGMAGNAMPAPASPEQLERMLRRLRGNPAAESLDRQLHAGWAIGVEDFAVLQRLALPGRQGAAFVELASTLGVPAASLLRRYIALERRGLVYRVATDVASHACAARVSAEGKRVLEAVGPVVRSVLQQGEAGDGC